MRSNKEHFVMPDARSAIRDPGDRRPHRLPLGSGFSLREPRNDERRLRAFLAVVALALLVAACATPPPPGPGEPGPNGAPPPIPLDGPIAYRCADGTQLMVDVDESSARVAIIGGPSMVLPESSEGYYTNGRYGFRGGGASGQWEVGRAAPANCTGS